MGQPHLLHSLYIHTSPYFRQLIPVIKPVNSQISLQCLVTNGKSSPATNPPEIQRSHSPCLGLCWAIFHLENLLIQNNLQKKNLTCSRSLPQLCQKNSAHQRGSGADSILPAHLEASQCLFFFCYCLLKEKTEIKRFFNFSSKQTKT